MAVTKEVEIPRDRSGEYKPVIIPEHHREFIGFDDKILSMHASTMTTR